MMMTAKQADLRMKSGPDVPAAAPRPLVADEPHFRDLGDGRSVLLLYLSGAHIAAGHVGLPAVSAVQVDSVWQPKPKRART